MVDEDSDFQFRTQKSFIMTRFLAITKLYINASRSVKDP